MEIFKQKPLWYAQGLAFECIGCGRCCSGPEEGYVWVNDEEITRIAAALRITPAEMRRRHLRRIAGRYSLIEKPRSRDCIFLEPSPDGNGKRCQIYTVRPAQCRTWPFWPSNLSDPEAWCEAADRCPGINRGPVHALDDIQTKKAATGE